MAYVDFNDDNIPLGKRKQAFVKWLMQRHRYTLEEAKWQAHRKFGPSEAQARQAQDRRTEQKWAQVQRRSHLRWGRDTEPETPSATLTSEDEVQRYVRWLLRGTEVD